MYKNVKASNVHVRIVLGTFSEEIDKARKQIRL